MNNPLKTSGYETAESEDSKKTPRPFYCNGIGRFSERLESVIGTESLRSFARKCGLSEGVLRSYIRKDTYPTLDRLDQIAEAADVSATWLLTGENTEDDQAGSEASELEEEFALVPGYNIQVSAGHGAFPDAYETPTRKLAFRHKWLRFRGLNVKDLVLVFAKGDSMEPTISDNNTLMVDTSQRDLQDGNIYVIRTDGHLIVKRVQQLWNKGILLISDNASYKEQQLSPEEVKELLVVGKVVWIGKDL